MGASGENGRKNPTRCGRTMSPLQVASSCSHAGFYSVVSRTAAANSSFLCTRNDHFGTLRALSTPYAGEIEEKLKRCLKSSSKSVDFCQIVCYDEL